MSYLNAKPLIDGLDEPAGAPIHLRYDVPARLLDDLETGDVDLALCPVIDYYRAARPLAVVPVGGIGSCGPTWTVRLYSRVPIEQITTVHADTDSHTSVALLQILLSARHDRRVRLIDYHARQHVADGRLAGDPEAVLLIGDKVVTDAPSATHYPHQLDLGQAWHALTGLPFVFAIWMTPVGTDLGDTPDRLAQQLDHNLGRIDTLTAQHAEPHGWPPDLAARYLSQILTYRTGPHELAAIERFGVMARDLGLIDSAGPLIRWRDPRSDPRSAPRSAPR